MLFLRCRYPPSLRSAASRPAPVGMAEIPALSLLLALLLWAGPADPSPTLLLRPRERESSGSFGNLNIAVIYSGSSLHPEMGIGAMESGGGGRVLYPGVAFGRVSNSLGKSIITQWGSANVIWLAVNDSSPRTLLLQLCELLASRPLQGLVYEEERAPLSPKSPLAPMLEFFSAQTGLPIVAVGGGAGLGRMPQVMHLRRTVRFACPRSPVFEYRIMATPTRNVCHFPVRLRYAAFGMFSSLCFDQ